MTAPIMQPCRPGCPVLVPQGTGRCPKHAAGEHRLDRERRGSARARGYDARWEGYRRAYLREHPLCVECAAGTLLPRGVVPRAVTAATVVDHIRAHKGDPELFWDPANHRAVCKPHHDARVDEGDFGRPLAGSVAHPSVGGGGVGGTPSCGGAGDGTGAPVEKTHARVF